MKRRLYLALAALAIASVAYSQSPAPKITYTTVAVPVERALDEISRQAGVKLTAAPLVSREIVILSLKNAPLDDVKIQIAKACSAKWEAVEGGEMLIPDLVQRRQEEQKERNEYANGIAKSLKQLVDSLNPPAKSEKGKAAAEEEAMMEELRLMSGGGPADRAVIKLMQGIGAANFASIDEKSRVVYATNPNRMQRPLPGNANQILAQLVTEYNADVLKQQRNKGEEVDVEDEQIKKWRELFGDFDFEDKPIEGTPSKALLICSRQRLFGGLMVTLKVYNEKGKVVITGSQTLTGDRSPFVAYEEVEIGSDGIPKPKPTNAKPKSTIPNEKPIQLSATTKELMEMSNFMTMSKAPSKMSEELRMKLLSPDQYDPLSFFHSEALIASANQSGKQLVACLPDDVDGFMGMMMPKEENLLPSSYLESISNTANVNAEGPFMLVRPAKPAKSRTTRCNRATLSAFVKNVEAKGSVSLDTLAAYAQTEDSPMEGGAAMTYFMIFAPNAIQTGFGGQVSWETLRFYGALSALQRKNLADGGRMAFNQLNPVAAGALRQMAFGPETNLVTDNPNAKKPEFELPQIFMESMMQRTGGDYRSEPTEVMPNGLPNDGYVELKLTQDNVAKPAGNVPSMFGNAVLGADELAMLKMFKDMPGMEAMSGFIPTIDEVKLGDRSIYEFKFVVAPSVHMTKTLNDDQISAKSPTVKMANLPAAFAKKIDDRIAVFKKIPFFDPAFFNPGGGSVPPPQ